ncbi:MAG: hypothetical protein HYX75_03730 [Acidobacteria bacterium]|nr:hypothetical protein [Acidobacteriota bacterium]
MSSGLLALILLLAPQSGWSPPLERADDDYLLLNLPREPMEDEEIRRRLASGLTTTLELVGVVEADTRKLTLSPASIDIRYDLWEEQFLVKRMDTGRAPSTRSLLSIEAIVDWLRAEPLRIASLQGVDRRATISVRVRCYVTPFSKAEEGRAKEWFSQALRVPSAGEGGGRAPQRAAGGEAEKQSVFAMLISTGIARRAVRTYDWSWTLRPR